MLNNTLHRLAYSNRGINTFYGDKTLCFPAEHHANAFIQELIKSGFTVPNLLSKANTWCVSFNWLLKQSCMSLKYNLYCCKSYHSHLWIKEVCRFRFILSMKYCTNALRLRRQRSSHYRVFRAARFIVHLTFISIRIKRLGNLKQKSDGQQHHTRFQIASHFCVIRHENATYYRDTVNKLRQSQQSTL